MAPVDKSGWKYAERDPENCCWNTVDGNEKRLYNSSVSGLKLWGKNQNKTFMKTTLSQFTTCSLSKRIRSQMIFSEHRVWCCRRLLYRGISSGLRKQKYSQRKLISDRSPRPPDWLVLHRSCYWPAGSAARLSLSCLLNCSAGACYQCLFLADYRSSSCLLPQKPPQRL